METALQAHNIVIRAASAADVPSLIEVHLDGWRAAYRGSPLQDAFELLPRETHVETWTRILGRHAEGLRVWVAERDLRVVGFIITGPVRLPIKSMADAAELYALYQLSTSARSGVAHFLVVQAVADLSGRNCRELWVWVLSANQPAQRFYEREGWRRVTERLFDHEGKELRQVCYLKSIPTARE